MNLKSFKSDTKIHRILDIIQLVNKLQQNYYLVI